MLHNVKGEILEKLCTVSFNVLLEYFNYKAVKLIEISIVYNIFYFTTVTRKLVGLSIFVIGFVELKNGVFHMHPTWETI